MVEAAPGPAHPRTPTRRKLRQRAREVLPALLSAVRGVFGASSFDPPGSSLFGPAAGMDRAESPGIFRAAAPVSGSRPGGTNRRGVLLVGSDFHSAGRPLGTDPAGGRPIGRMGWAAPEGRLVGRTPLGT